MALEGRFFLKLPRGKRHLRLVQPGDNPPRTRGDCIDGERPCALISCRHHLGSEVTFAGTLMLRFDDDDVSTLAETCSLDVADRRAHSVAEVAEILGVSTERVRQIEAVACKKLAPIVEQLT